MDLRSTTLILGLLTLSLAVARKPFVSGLKAGDAKKWTIIIDDAVMSGNAAQSNAQAIEIWPAQPHNPAPAPNPSPTYTPAPQVQADPWVAPVPVYSPSPNPSPNPAAPYWTPTVTATPKPYVAQNPAPVWTPNVPPVWSPPSPAPSSPNPAPYDPWPQGQGQQPVAMVWSGNQGGGVPWQPAAASWQQDPWAPNPSPTYTPTPQVQADPWVAPVPVYSPSPNPAVQYQQQQPAVAQQPAYASQSQPAMAPSGVWTVNNQQQNNRQPWSISGVHQLVQQPWQPYAPHAPAPHAPAPHAPAPLPWTPAPSPTMAPLGNYGDPCWWNPWLYSCRKKTTTTTSTTSTTTTMATTTSSPPPTTTTPTMTTAPSSTIASTTGLTTTPAPVPSLPVGQLPANGCPDPFVSFNNTQVLGGSLVTGVTTLAACQSACILSTTCRALDFNANTNQCFTFSIAMQGQAFILQGVTHQQKTQCTAGAGAAFSFLTCSSGRHILGGTLQAGAGSIVSCQNNCAITASCQAIDFNFVTNQCFFHMSDSSCNTLVVKNSCIHCKRVACAMMPAPNTAPSGYSNEFIGFHILGGAQQTGNFTTQGCLNACTASTTCAGVDYNKATACCWFHTTTTACNSLVTKNECTHFRKLGTTCPAPAG